MNDANMKVLTNTIGAVESGGQIYGHRRYDAYAAPFTNSNKEYTITLGWAQNYGPEAYKLILMIYTKDPQAFEKIDPQGSIKRMINGEHDWVKERWNPSAAQKKILVALIDSPVGHECQDNLFAQLMNKYIPDCEKTYTKDVKAVMMYCEIRHLGGKGPADRIFKKCNGNYSLDNIMAALKQDQSDTSSSNQVGDKKFWSRHEKCREYIEKYAVPEGAGSKPQVTSPKKASDLDIDDWIVAVRAVAEYARIHGYTYGDSHATPPTADKKISCDRLVARALWDRGFTDQPVSTTSTSGITVGNMDGYLVKHGFEKGASFSDIRKGSIVVVGDTVPRHTFVTASYDPNAKTFVKYDCGSQARINAKQPFTETWAYQKLFAVYNIPQKKAGNGGSTKVSTYSPDTVIAIAKNEVGYLEKRSNAQLDSKTGNAGSGNYTKYWRDLRPSYQGEAWCDCFVDWCFQKAYGKTAAQTLECGGFGEYYTPTSAQCYKNAGRYDKNPQVGDQIFFKNTSRICHTGIVYAVANGRVYTIEGNTSNGTAVIANGGAVCMKSYLKSNSRIAGYGHPRYNATSTVKQSTDVPTANAKTTGGSKYMFEVKLVKQGDKNTSTLLLQEILKARGLYKGDLDWIAGPDTITALKQYQKQRGLTVDGQCGPKTWKDLLGM